MTLLQRRLKGNCYRQYGCASLFAGILVRTHISLLSTTVPRFQYLTLVKTNFVIMLSQTLIASLFLASYLSLPTLLMRKPWHIYLAWALHDNIWIIVKPMSSVWAISRWGETLHLMKRKKNSWHLKTVAANIVKLIPTSLNDLGLHLFKTNWIIFCNETECFISIVNVMLNIYHILHGANGHVEYS
jgi:hypothetical protein